MLRAEPWYHFVRLVRNALSHNFHFEFSDTDKKRLPLTFRGRTMTPAMDGQPLTLDFLDHALVWELFNDMYAFGRTRLN